MYQEAALDAIRKIWPEINENSSQGANVAPLSELNGVLDIVSACLDGADGGAYNPLHLTAQASFAWAHVRLTGQFGYPTQSQLVAHSLLTGKVMTSDISLVTKNNCQTYMVELTQLSR